MSTSNEFIIDGNEINKQLEALKIEAYSPTLELHHQLMGQVFEDIEKKFLKGLADQIVKANPDLVRVINLEAIATGPHRDYLSPICGGLAELIDALRGDIPVPLWPNFIKLQKKIPVTGDIQNPWILPWHIVAKLNKDFKGFEQSAREAASVTATQAQQDQVEQQEPLAFAEKTGAEQR